MAIHSNWNGLGPTRLDCQNLLRHGSWFWVLQVVVGALALLAFIQFQTRFIMWSWKLFRVSFPIPNAVSVSCFFFPFDNFGRAFALR